MKELKPNVYVTFNGDYFDWPFIEQRATKCGMNLFDELSFTVDSVTGECRSRISLHLDAFCWVKRDSYLPQGSQGLKSTTKAKLGFDPIEISPEDMLPYAKERPHEMAA